MASRFVPVSLSSPPAQLSRRQALLATAACLGAAGSAQAQVQSDEHLREITHDVALPALGNARGDVTVVKFFDYQCAYCKRSWHDAQALLKSDPGVRLVMRDLFVYGESSRYAARLALAAARQGKYAEVVDGLLTHSGRLNEDKVHAVLTERGVDLPAAQAWVRENDDRLQALFARNQRLAQSLGFRGTPSYLIGRRRAPGAVSLDVMQLLVAEAREK